MCGALSERRAVRSLALPLLESVYGTLDRERSLELLHRALDERPTRELGRIWLMDGFS
jgi:hypothetical protein